MSDNMPVAASSIEDISTQELERRMTLLTERSNLIEKFIKTNLKDGLDYGKIPGTQKSTLFLAGAEKFAQMFRLRPEYEVVKDITDFDKPMFYREVKCRLLDGAGNVVAEALAVASSREAKHRWRNQERVCPECGKPFIFKSKYPPKSSPGSMPGWYCFAKKGGCGAEFSANDERIIGQSLGKVENPDMADTLESVVMMSQKRAFVKATRTLGALSDRFTQDIEDTPDDKDAVDPEEERPTGQRTGLNIGQFKAARQAYAKAQGVSLADMDKRIDGILEGQPLESLTDDQRAEVYMELTTKPPETPKTPVQQPKSPSPKPGASADLTPAQAEFLKRIKEKYPSSKPSEWAATLKSLNDSAKQQFGDIKDWTAVPDADLPTLWYAATGENWTA